MKKSSTNRYHLNEDEMTNSTLNATILARGKTENGIQEMKDGGSRLADTVSANCTTSVLMSAEANGIPSVTGPTERGMSFSEPGQLHAVSKK